jgi:Arc/MetJ-type ribon-helix-helix transcriptional regulator
MPISLPPDLDARIQQKVAGAGYRSPDEVIRKALDALDATEQHEAPPPPAKGKKSPAVPLWQRFQNAVRSIPKEELATLPPDGASEHDHYLYGLPKRSA